MFAIAALCVIIGLLYYFLEMKRSRMKRLTSNMPSPKHYPIIGCALEFGSNSDEILQGFMRISSLGPVVSAWIGSQLYIILSGSNEIQTILSNKKLLTKAQVYDYVYPWLGNGLINSAGEEWRRQRKIITPAFHFKILEQFVDMFSSNLEIFVNKLKSEVGKDGFDITSSVAACMLDVISETSMGTRIHAQLKKEESSFVQAINDVTTVIIKRCVYPWLHPLLLFNILPEGRLFYRQIKVIHRFVSEVINIRRKELEKSEIKSNSNDKESSELGEKKQSAFLDLLIEYNLTDEELKNQVNTFMFAGHDTTASAVSFTIYCLMKHPEVQEKVFKEQMEILGDSNSFATSSDLKNMKYLERVINETLRLYPSVPLIGRTMTEDFQLTPDHILPKGCTVTLVLHKLHRDPKIYPNPEVFNPDRFLPEEVQGRNPYAFCPFSAGPRNCIGQKFAMQELKATISAVVRRFKILPPINCPDLILGSELVLRSLTGVYVRLENR